MIRCLTQILPPQHIWPLWQTKNWAILEYQTRPKFHFESDDGISYLQAALNLFPELSHSLWQITSKDDNLNAFLSRMTSFSTKDLNFLHPGRLLCGGLPLKSDTNDIFKTTVPCQMDWKTKKLSFFTTLIYIQTVWVTVSKLSNTINVQRYFNRPNLLVRLEVNIR